MFVRKRDPRYKAHLKAQSQPTITSPPAKPPPLQTKAESVPAYIEQEWQKTNLLGVEDLEWVLAEGNDDPEVFECVVCGKSFKSEAAWNSHERSKKHIKNVEVLRRRMEEEGMELGLSDPSDELGPKHAEGQSEGSVTPPPDHGSGTEHETLRDTRESPESREQVASAEETLPGGTDTGQTSSQSEQKLSKRDKRRLREAKKQAQTVEDTHVSSWQIHAGIRLTIGYRNVTFAKRNSRAERGCSIT